MKNTTLKICNETVHPGETITMALPLPKLFSCAPLYMPIKVVHGKYAGPTLLVIGAMHGNEINGTEIINRLLTMPALRKISGTLIAIPVLNVYGLINRTGPLPGGVNLDTCFPGNEHGSTAQRLANVFSTQIFSKADYCIDLQTGPLNYSNLPQVYINVKDGRSRTLAKSFNAPVVLDAIVRDGSLRQLAETRQVPYLMYEAGEAMRFGEDTIKTGLNGIINVMRKLMMLPEKAHKKYADRKHYVAEKYVWVHSSASGISHSKHLLGKHVKQDEVLCVIKDPFGMSDDVTVKSPHDGIIIGMNNLPLVQEGEGVYQLAVFPEMHQIESDLQEWSNEHSQELMVAKTVEN